MTPVYTAKLGLVIWKTDIDAYKIDGSNLDTYGLVIVGCLV